MEVIYILIALFTLYLYSQWTVKQDRKHKNDIFLRDEHEDGFRDGLDDLSMRSGTDSYAQGHAEGHRKLNEIRMIGKGR